MANQWDHKCPECGDEDNIDVSATVWVRLTSDGTDADESADGSHAWDGTSQAHCCECGWLGKVSELAEVSVDDEEETEEVSNG